MKKERIQTRRQFLTSLAAAPILAPWFLRIADAGESEAFKRAQTFEDAHAASCRVNVSNARGTGTFIGVENGRGIILTNYHVVTNSKRASVDFWTNSEKETATGDVVWRYYDAGMPADFALIAVEVEKLKRIAPPFVAIGGEDARPGVHSFIVSAGAPDGRFVQSWKGKIDGYYQGETVLFSPPPVPGQSGSGILEYYGDELFLTGVLTWLIGEKGADESKGGAIPIANLYAAFKRGRRAPTTIPANSTGPIPPNATEC